jgi:glutamate transport system substrate-binding protein
MSDGGTATPPRRRGGTLRNHARLVLVLALLVVAAVVAGLIVAVTGPPSEDELFKQAGLVGKRQLLVGVKDDQPGVALLDPRTGVYTGFDIDVAYMIAGDLGYRPSEVRFLSIESEDRERMRARDPAGRTVTVDLVVASYSITAAREAAGARFSAPYLRTEQSVLTRTGHPPVHALSDLRNERVCTLSTSTSAAALTAAGIADAHQENEIGECAQGMFDGRHYQAVTTDAAILAGFAHDPRYRGRVVHQDIGLDTSENWGVNVGPNEALRTLVNLSLYRSWHDPNDRRWEDAFDHNLRPEQVDSPEQDVAIDQQPEVAKPAVRQWPWQR